MSFTVGVVIISDRASRGERKDECLSVIQAALDASEFSLAESAIVSDDPDEIRTVLSSFIDSGYSLILTSGGTGCAPRDNSPEVTQSLLDRPTPGLDEAVRAYSREKAPYAMFSRAVSGVAKNSYLINMPGSPKAVREIIEFVLPLIKHPLKLIAGNITDCQEDLAGR
jgi:molybdenum cofactor synthesis domain-containing protein